jgi:hypothetical protein
MAAGKYNFVIEQGATTDFQIEYKDGNNDPVDLTDYSGRMSIKSAIGGDVYINLSSSLGPCGTGLNFSGSNGDNPPTSGSIGIFISAVSSSALDFTEGVYDLEIYSGSNCEYVIRLLEGNVKLSKQVTTIP